MSLQSKNDNRGGFRAGLLHFPLSPGALPASIPVKFFSAVLSPDRQKSEPACRLTAGLIGDLPEREVVILWLGRGGCNYVQSQKK